MNQSITQLDREQIFLLYTLTESARALATFDGITRLAALTKENKDGFIAVSEKSIDDSLRHESTKQALLRRNPLR